MTLAELTPDVALAALYDNNVAVQTSATESRTVRCYADGKQPNKGLADEFLTVMWNGAASARLAGAGLLSGNLALSVYCKTQADGTVKTQRVRQMLAQCQSLADGIAHGGFFFRLDPSQVITPTTPNLTTGYSVTVVNVLWRESYVNANTNDTDNNTNA